MATTRRDADPSAPQVYLVPGFLGFQRLDALRYFDDEVVAVLEEAVRGEWGAAPVVERAETEATASIARRAARLLAYVADRMDRTTGPLYFVGHSTGGLDARLLASPGADIDLSGLARDGRDGAALEAALATIRKRTRAVVSLATPHYGAPLANRALALNAHLLVAPLAYLASAAPFRRALAESIGQTVRLAAQAWVAEPVRGWIATATGLLGRDGELDPRVFDYLAQIARDQGAIFQLTPQGTNLFNAAVGDAAGVAYASVLTVAPPPRIVRTDLAFHALHWLTSRTEPAYGYPPLDESVVAHLAKALPFPVSPGSNDGIVPTRGQVHGRVAAVVVADHLDVVGMFPRDCDGEPQPGWLQSGAGFRERELRATWHCIARALVHPESLPELPPVIHARATPERRVKKAA